MVQSLTIVLLSVVAAIVYGVAHDQITARVCVEYFTIGHPPIFHTTDPTILALGWGIVATWWVGLPLGVALAIAARAGGAAPREARTLVGPILRLLAIMAASAASAGTAGYVLARFDVIWLQGPLAARVPADCHDAFLADLWAHSASYLLGVLGGGALTVHTWRSRQRVAR